MTGLRRETQFWLTAMDLEALAESVITDHVICRLQGFSYTRFNPIPKKSLGLFIS